MRGLFALVINKVFLSTLSDEYTNIWLDLRILLFSKYLDNYNIINENLTFYRQTESNVSSKFKKYSKNWWRRRYEAHQYFFEFIKKNDLMIKKNFDYYISKIINKFI